jgi:hypothetical protein
VVEDISHRSEALEIDRVFGIDFKILPKADNEIVHGSGGGAPGVTPADFEELAS